MANFEVLTTKRQLRRTLLNSLDLVKIFVFYGIPQETNFVIGSVFVVKYLGMIITQYACLLIIQKDFLSRV